MGTIIGQGTRINKSIKVYKIPNDNFKMENKNE
jgi:hypothetical protein